MHDRFDVIVIGAGPGGYVAAIKAAKKGLKTAVVENRRVGGTCLNRGCIPTKAMIHAAEAYRNALAGSRFGIHASDVSFDYGEIISYREETIDTLVGGIEKLMGACGITIRIIEVGNERPSARAASNCPESTDWMPPRMISET